MHRLPSGRDTVPALVEPGGAPYYGGAAPEAESRDSPLRATLLRYLNLAVKYKWLIAAFVAAGLFAGFVVTFLSTKLYTASTTVKIDRAMPKVLKDSSQDNSADYDPQFYQTQYELIKSRSLAERVALALNLAQTDFVGRVPSEPLNGDELRQRQAAAAGLVAGGLAVQPVALSSIVRVSYTSNSPKWAQAISIAVAEQYERSTLDRRFNASSHARGFLEDRLQELKVKLQDAEKQLIAYAQKEGIVNVDDKQPQATAALRGVQDAMSAAVMERIKAEQMWQQAQGDGGLSLPQVMTDPLIRAARERIATLQATYQDKLSTLKPAFPEMVALKAQITEAERQIRQQIERVRKTIQAQYETAAAQEAALRDKVEQVKTEVLDLRGRSVEYNILQREADTARSLYDGVLQQFKELGVVGSLDTNNISIIDRADLPGAPISPSLRKNLLISLVLSLMAAAGVVGLREVLDDTFKSAEDLEERLGLAVLGVTPRLDGATPPLDEVFNNPGSALAEAYRSLRTALQFTTEDGCPKTLLVTSSQPGEGKSTTSAAVAIQFAQLGQRVLLVDADMRNPSLHKTFAIDNAKGLSNFLSGVTEASQLVKSAKGLTLMTAGPVPPNPAELLARPRLATLLASAGAAFDIIIIDAPPVMGLADVPILASLADATILVVEAGQTRRPVVRDALKRLHFARARLAGAVLSKFDPKKAGFQYGYGSGYGAGAPDYFAYGGQAKADPQLPTS